VTAEPQLDTDYLIDWTRAQQRRSQYAYLSCSACWHRFHGVRCQMEGCTCPASPEVRSPGVTPPRP
jgi:hypothetical protein